MANINNSYGDLSLTDRLFDVLITLERCRLLSVSDGHWSMSTAYRDAHSFVLDALGLTAEEWDSLQSIQSSTAQDSAQDVESAQSPNSHKLNSKVPGRVLTVP